MRPHIPVREAIRVLRGLQDMAEEQLCSFMNGVGEEVLGCTLLHYFALVHKKDSALSGAKPLSWVTTTMVILSRARVFIVLASFPYNHLSQSHVLKACLMGKEVEQLKYHAVLFPNLIDVHIPVIDIDAVDNELPAVYLLDAIEVPQKCALPRAARADDDHSLTLLDLRRPLVSSAVGNSSH